jgi:hypothetical protein
MPIKNRFLKLLFLFVFCIFQIVFHAQAKFPTLLYHDPMPLYSPRGVDVLPPLKSQFEQERRWVSWNLSFFQQQAKSARNDRSIKVPVGDRLGRLNASGFFFGTKLKFENTATPADGILDFSIALSDKAKAKFPALTKAFTEITAVGVDAEVFTKPDKFKFDFFDDEKNNAGFMSIESSFKKRGFRSMIMCEPFDFVRCTLQFGCVEYSYSGNFISKTTNASEVGAVESDLLLTNQQKITEVAGGFGLDFSKQQKTTIEDIMLGAELMYPIILSGIDREPAVMVYPFFGAGIWIPTGAKSDPNKVFSLATGNEGFLGGGLKGGLIFHFLDMLYVSFEGSCVFFDTKDVVLRYPTHRYHQGLYPFAKQFSKKPGLTWNLDLSMAVRHVVEGLSFYIDFIYQQHERDTISAYIPIPEYLTLETAKTDETEFYVTSSAYEVLPQTDFGSLDDAQIHDVLSQASFWKQEMFTVGFSYEVTPGFEVGLAFRGNLSGKQIVRTETIMGTLRFAF